MKKAILQTQLFKKKLFCSNKKFAHYHGVAIFSNEKTALKRILFPIMKTRHSLIWNAKESIMFFLGVF